MSVISATVIVIAEVATIVAGMIKIVVDAVTMTPEMVSKKKAIYSRCRTVVPREIRVDGGWT